MHYASKTRRALLAAAVLLVVFAACATAGATDVASLVAAARAREEKFQASVSDLTVQQTYHGAKGIDYEQVSMAMRKGVRRRKEVRNRGRTMGSIYKWGELTIYDGRDTWEWEVGRGRPASKTQSSGKPRYARREGWFDMLPLSLGNAVLVGEAEVGDLNCYVIEVPTERLGGQVCYVFGRLSQDVIEAADLHLVGYRVALVSGEWSLKVYAAEGVGWPAPEDAAPYLLSAYTRFWVDVQDLELVKTEGVAQDSHTIHSTVYSDFRTIAKDKRMAFRWEWFSGDKPMGGYVVTSVVVNSGLSDDLFLPERVDEKALGRLLE